MAAAQKEAQMQWKWVDAQTDAYVFVSGEHGQFEVNGLLPGTYSLKEIKAPAGFALPTNEIEFKIGEGGIVNIPYEPTGTENNAQQITNVKVTIPQTGGIGTIIFGVVGVTLMGGAVVAFKKSEDDEE